MLTVFTISGWRGGFWDRQICKISKDDVGSYWEAGHQVVSDEDCFGKIILAGEFFFKVFLELFSNFFYFQNFFFFNFFV